MPRSSRKRPETSFHEADRTLYETLMVIGFCLTMLGFLIAIGRPHWFHVRPGSGTGMAMARAASQHAVVDAAAETAR